MRIISGKYKGKLLFSPIGEDIRPTTDRVKENIFNLIQGKITGANVLDLFCGSGAMGIECLSRGAKSVCFNDKSMNAMELLKNNLVGIDDPSTCFNLNYKSCLEKLSKNDKCFDIIFLDPPYEKGYESELLSLIEYHNLLASDGIIIMEKSINNDSFNLPLSFDIVDNRAYGKTEISVFERKSKVLINGTFDPFTLGHWELLNYATENFDSVYLVIMVNSEKECMFPLKCRKEIIEQIQKSYKNKVKVDYHDGLCVDFCKKYGIQYIVRGIRNETDEAYEQMIAKYNLDNGGIKTIFINSSTPHISAKIVRQRLSEGETLDEFLDKQTIKILNRYNRNINKKQKRGNI